MNIFFLSWNPTKCAQYHFDRHVIKMILELAQMLCTAHHVLGSNTLINGYKATHINHPTCKWVREHLHNYIFCARIAIALCDEYFYRYGQHKSPQKQHSSRQLIEWLINNPPKNIPTISLKYIRLTNGWYMTLPPQAMPDEYKCDNPIEGYRMYYQSDMKAHIRGWKNRDVPEWFE